MTNAVLKGKVHKMLAHLIIILIIVFGITFIVLNIIASSNNWSSWLTTMFGNIGASLLASGVTYLLVLPKMKYKEQELFQETYEKNGFRGVDITSETIVKAQKSIHRSFDVLTDSVLDVREILQIIQLRGERHKPEYHILLKQPVAVENAEYDRAVEELIKVGYPIRFYNYADLPCYCKIDEAVITAYATSEGNRVLNRYQATSPITNELDIWFQTIWNGVATWRGKEIRVSETTYGRTLIDQDAAVESILSYFTERFRIEIGITKPVEAVIVLWTQKEKQRETIYSCNKPEKADKHVLKDYDHGIVGKLQDKVKIDTEKTHDCVILYDKEYKETKYRIMRFDRAGEIKEDNIDKQNWDSPDTKAMLAIPFLKGEREMIGALTYDIGETLKGLDEAHIRSAMENIKNCRDLVSKLLGTNLKTNQEKWLINLESKESKSGSMTGV